MGMGTSAPLLTSAGVEWIALDLPGHGEDRGPFGDLRSDVARVRETLDEFDGDVVCSSDHSYGGAVITEAGLHPAVQHLVYVAAFALDVGESCVSVAAEVEASLISHEGRPNLGAGFIMSSGDMITLDPSSAAECLYNDCRRRHRRLGVSPPRPSTAHHTAGKAKPCCLADQAVHLRRVRR